VPEMLDGVGESDLPFKGGGKRKKSRCGDGGSSYSDGECWGVLGLAIYLEEGRGKRGGKAKKGKKSLFRTQGRKRNYFLVEKCGLLIQIRGDKRKER